MLLLIGSSKNHDLNDRDVYFLIKWLQFILIVILQPLFCLLGILNNTLVIVVINNKNKQFLFRDVMYKHILINSMFNLCLSVLMLLSLVNTCVFYESNRFCSSVFRSDSAQYFKIVGGEFLVNALKTCSNFSYIFFSFSRLILVANLKETLVVFRKFENLNLYLYTFAVVLFGLLLSAYKLFEFQLNEVNVAAIGFPYEIYNEQYCGLFGQYCRFMDFLKIFNDSFNDIALFTCNILIDLILLRFFKKDLKHKVDTRSPNADNSDLIRSKKNIDRMIMTTGLIYFVSHMPEFCVTIGLLVFRERVRNFCTNYNACLVLNEEARFFTLISILFQFYILLLYNRNFRESFFDLLERFKLFILRNKHR